MGLKENWLRKMAIERLCLRIIRSIASGSEGERRLDKAAVKELLDIAGYRHHRERDLDLYLPPPASPSGAILVLDNDLGFYRTDISDIALRKSPTVKEMVSIRNAIKILNDKDVVVSKKADSVERLKQEAIQTLDLSITEAGVAEILDDARHCLRNRYAEGLEQVLSIVADMLGYSVDPKPFAIEHHRVIGRVHNAPGEAAILFPAAVYGRIHHRLIWLKKPVSSADPDAVRRYPRLSADPDPEWVLQDEEALEEIKAHVMRLSVDGVRYCGPGGDLPPSAAAPVTTPSA